MVILGVSSAMAQFPMGAAGMNNTASAPSFVQPNAQESGFGWLETEFPMVNAQFAWTPAIANNAPATRFIYDFRIKRVIPGQEVVDAADNGTIAFEQCGLMTTMCMLPQNVVETLRNSGTEYFVAQVFARPMGGARVMMTNDGKSQIMLLHFAPQPEQIPTPDDSTENE